MPERERPKIPNPQFLSGTADGGIAIHGKVVRKVLKRKDLLTGGGRSFGGWLPVP